jgi:peptidoglycan/LPS O-acetylase OafA/YrhL
MSGVAVSNQRNNNLGFLRLLFAILVIVSHAPELIDGNRSREILTRLFHTLSFGEIAVDGFFLISGYLITQSFVLSRSVYLYLVKRLARILPGYLVSFWICVLFVAPFAGPRLLALAPHTILHQFSMMLRLLPPDTPGVFPGIHYPVLNGALWTVAYEFRCYLAVALLGMLGAFHSPRARYGLLAAVAALLLLNSTGAGAHIPAIGVSYIGTPENNIRFFSVFGTGALYYLFRDKIQLTNRGALAAGIFLIILFFNRHLAEMAYSLLGGYLIFWFAFKIEVLHLSRLDNKTDISYGLYLYAWPVEMILLQRCPGISPWLLGSATFLIAALLGYASWISVEKPALDLAHKYAKK